MIKKKDQKRIDGNKAQIMEKLKWKFIPYPKCI